jgi:hypothetical protein
MIVFGEEEEQEIADVVQLLHDDPIVPRFRRPLPVQPRPSRRVIPGDFTAVAETQS